MKILLLLFVSLILAGAASLAGAATLQLAPAPADSARALSAEVLAPVSIGSKGDFKDYYRIDTGCPLLIQGPGMLRFYVRAHVDTAGPAPSEVTVVLAGLAGFPEQTWTRPVSPSRVAAYGDGREGRLTDGQKISLAIPGGLQQVTVTGTSNTGRPVYALFYYEGPPVAAPGEAEAAGAAAGTPGAAGAEPSATRPAEPAAEEPESPWGLSSNFYLGMIYDDNICRYSDSTLEEFSAGTDPENFAIETDDDLIINPAIDAEVSHARLLFGKESRFRVRYQRWDYARNGIKTNEEVNLRARQIVRASDYVEASFTYAPKNYVKELSDRPPFTSTSVEREYLHFEVKRNALFLAYYWRTSAWLRLRFQGSRTWRFYNRPFLENDLWEWAGQASADLRYRRLTTRLQYAYADVQARGYDEVGETLETADNESDGSYEKDTYMLRFSYAPRKRAYVPGEAGPGFLGQAWWLVRSAGALIDRGLVRAKTAGLDLEFTYSRQFYTSTLPLYLDATHVGRLDETRQVEITWSSQPIYRKASLEAGWRFTERTADAPAGLIGEDDPSEEKDYTGGRFWVAVSTPLR